MFHARFCCFWRPPREIPIQVAVKRFEIVHLKNDFIQNFKADRTRDLLKSGSRNKHRRRRSTSRSTSHGHQLRVDECELKEELFRVLIPVHPELSLLLLDLSAWYFEWNRLVRFSSEQQVLPFTIWWLNLLLVGRHETVAGNDSIADFRIIDLEKQRLLAAFRISLLCHSITRSTNL